MSSISSLYIPTVTMLPTPSDSLKEKYKESDEKILSITIAKLENLIVDTSHSDSQMPISQFSDLMSLINTAFLLAKANEVLYKYLCKILETKFTKLLDILVIRLFFLAIRNASNYERVNTLLTPHSFERVSELIEFVYAASKVHNIKIAVEVTSEILKNIKILGKLFNTNISPTGYSTFDPFVKKELGINLIPNISIHLTKIEQLQFSLLEEILHHMSLNILQNCELSDIIIQTIYDGFNSSHKTKMKLEEIKIILLRYKEVEHGIIQGNTPVLLKSLVSKASERAYYHDENILLNDLALIYKESFEKELILNNVNNFDEQTIIKKDSKYPINYGIHNYKYHLRNNLKVPNWVNIYNKSTKSQRIYSDYKSNSSLVGINDNNVDVPPAKGLSNPCSLKSKNEVTPKTKFAFWKRFRIKNLKQYVYSKGIALPGHQKSHKF